MLKTILGIVLLGASAAVDAASVVSDYVTFIATSFTSFPSTASVPTDPVTGAFTITLNPTQNYIDSTSGITLGSLNIPHAGGLHL